MLPPWMPMSGQRIAVPRQKQCQDKQTKEQIPKLKLPTLQKEETRMKKIAFKCLECGAISAHTGDGYNCPACSGYITPIGHFVERRNNEVTVSVKADGLDEIEKQLKRINSLIQEVIGGIRKLQIK
jgi:hypothetical protein